MKHLKLLAVLLALFTGMGQVSASVLDKVFENLTLPTGIHKAAANGNSKKIRELISQGVDVNLLDKNKETPLHHALKGRDKFKTVRTLLDRKANVHAKNNDGNTPLHYASSPTIAKLLLDRGADIDVQNPSGITILHVAVVSGQLRLVKMLLNEGARPDIAGNNGITPLHLATAISYFKNDAVLKGVIAGPQPRAKGALVIATIGGVAAVLGARLIILGAELEYLYRFMVAFAAKQGEPFNYTRTQVMKASRLLVAEGQEYPFRSKATKIAAVVVIAILSVIFAIDIGIRNKILGSLLDHNANPNARDKAGNTPLHTLADGKLLSPGNRRGGVLMAKHLIYRGANPLIKNNAGQLPYDIAKEHKRFSLYGTLRPGAVKKRQERKEKWKEFKGDVVRKVRGEHEAA